MFNISRSTHSKIPIFGMHMDILTNSRLSGKKLQLEPLVGEIFRFNRRIGPKNELQLPKQQVWVCTDYKID